MDWGFVTCGPNKVMVISGLGRSPPLLVPGGRAFVLPCVQRVEWLSLNVMTLIIESTRIYTKLGVPITVTGVAQVKINGANEQMLYAACEHFLGKREKEVSFIAQETLESHQRAIMGNMTVEEIYQDRKKFSEAVFEVASVDLINMGISIVSYTLKDIKDDQGYLHALGLTRTAQVKCQARIGEAHSQRDSKIRQAEAERETIAAQLKHQIETAKAKCEFDLKNAAYEIEIKTSQAEADAAHELQVAITKKKLKEEEMQVKLVQQTQMIQVEELEVQRAKNNLEATVRQEADAERFRVETIANAERLRLVAEAVAEADAIRACGQAEAEALLAKGKAEADRMRKKASAWNNFKDVAKLKMSLEALPKISAEISAPLAQCGRLTMVSSGDGEIGAFKLVNEIISIINSMPKLINEITGVNISNIMKTKE